MRLIVKDTKANRDKRICHSCPSYSKERKGKLLYCSMEKSKCDIKEAGCICKYIDRNFNFRNFSFSR